MSDRVTNVEIEDVLSSIRRLVSEDTRPRPAPRPAPQPDRLVLTPALRVKEAEQDDDAIDAELARDGDLEPVLLTEPRFAAPAFDARPDDEDDIVAASGDDRIEAVGLPEAEEEDHDAWDMPDEAEPEAFLAREGADMGDGDSGLTADSVLSKLVEQEIARAFEQEEDDRAPASEATLAEAEEHSAGSDIAWSMPESAETDPVDAMVVRATTGVEDDRADAWDDVEDTDVLPWSALQDEDATSEPAPQSADGTPGSAPQAVEDQAPTELERKIAALEQMVARKAEDWDGDSPDAGGNAAFVHRPVEVLDWRDTDMEPQPDYTGTAPSGEPAAAPGHWYGEDPVTIDEDMLRDMVAEIVRQELQGALGERITRNVRKLVRREIHRVLMSQEFD